MIFSSTFLFFISLLQSKICTWFPANDRGCCYAYTSGATGWKIFTSHARGSWTYYFSFIAKVRIPKQSLLSAICTLNFKCFLSLIAFILNATWLDFLCCILIYVHVSLKKRRRQNEMSGKMKSSKNFITNEFYGNFSTPLIKIKLNLSEHIF